METHANQLARALDVLCVMFKSSGGSLITQYRKSLSATLRGNAVSFVVEALVQLIVTSDSRICSQKILVFTGSNSEDSFL